MTTLARTVPAFAGAAERELRPASRPETRAPSGALEGRARSATLALEGVSLSFGGVAALRDVDLAFADGSITAVIGPNGAGKTSLINVITGVYTPDQGRILIKGQAYTRSPTSRLAALGVARTFRNSGFSRGSRPSTTSRLACPLRRGPPSSSRFWGSAAPVPK